MNGNRRPREEAANQVQNSSSSEFAEFELANVPAGSLPEKKYSVVQYVTIKEAIARYGCGKTTLYSLLNREGGVVAVKLGSRTLIDVASGDAYFATLPRFGRKWEIAQ